MKRTDGFAAFRVNGDAASVRRHYVHHVAVKVTCAGLGQRSHHGKREQ
jgi:hypothetical protein